MNQDYSDFLSKSNGIKMIQRVKWFEEEDEMEKDEYGLGVLGL